MPDTTSISRTPTSTTASTSQCERGSLWFRSPVIALDVYFVRPGGGDVGLDCACALSRVAQARSRIQVTDNVDGDLDVLTSNDTLEVWKTAVLYHLAHGVALLALALHGATNRGAFYLLLAGVMIFSGSLYLLALTNARWLGAITPLGGLCFLAGWAWLILSPPR